jgi:hypothetical protein
MDLNKFLTAAERFQNLGTAVQKQLQRVISRPKSIREGEINKNALNMIEDFLGHLVENFEDTEIEGEAMSVLVDIEEETFIFETMEHETEMDTLEEDELLGEDIDLPEK